MATIPRPVSITTALAQYAVSWCRLYRLPESRVADLVEEALEVYQDQLALGRAIGDSDPLWTAAAAYRCGLAAIRAGAVRMAGERS